MMSLVSYILYIVLSLPVLLYLRSKWKLSYWRRKGVQSPEQTKSKQVGLSEPAYVQLMQNYRKYKAKGEKHFGVYQDQNQNPSYVPIDLDIIKDLLTTDFDHFRNHGYYANEEEEPLTANLFNLSDEKWKLMRAKLTPAFTSGKMKMMFHTIVDRTAGLEKLVLKHAEEKKPMEAKDVMSRFTTDVIGNVAFGIECNTMEDPNAEFAYYAKQIMQLGHQKLGIMAALARNILPSWLFVKVGFKIMGKELGNFFFNLVEEAIEYREKNNIYRKDFLQMMIQLKKHGRLSDDEKVVIKSSSNEQGLSMKQVTAQCFVFFTAGFDTSSTTMMFALFEIAQNPDVQEKVREEINRVLKKHDGKITYEAVMEMEYLDKVIAETLRLFPPLPLLPRRCTEDYHVPNTDVVIDKGTAVIVPLYSIHHDPEYFPDPEKFDPERFSQENKSTRHPYAYMPFGEGPRACIGLRFGKLQSKVGLISVIKNFKVTVNEKTTVPIKLYPSFLIFVAGGIWLNVEKLS